MDADLDTEAEPEAVGVHWNNETESFVPTIDCSDAPIPRAEDLDPAVLAAIKSRLLVSNVQRHNKDTRPEEEQSGILQGLPFFSRQCKTCKGPLLPQDVHCVRTGEILVHSLTYSARHPVLSCKCPSCLVFVPWIPAHDGIHTIKNGSEGGELSSVKLTECSHVLI